MKTFASILVGSALLLGCSQHEVKYQTGTLEWEEDSAILSSFGASNHTLIIYSTIKTQNIYTNVDSLDQAANILGQYGWELVSSESVNDRKTYHMKRQVQEGDDGQFKLVHMPVTDFQK